MTRARLIARRLMAAACLLVLAGVATAPPARATETAIVVDARLGAVLFADEPNRRVPPASLAKMMTAYLVFEDLRASYLRLSDTFFATEAATKAAPVRVGLTLGEAVPVDDALKALLGDSANDVAVMIAENLGGTEAAFAQRMTETAARLGMTRSRFATASGLPAPLDAQFTTARDMALLALALMRDFPGFYHRYFSLIHYRYKGRPHQGHNVILSRYPGADGLKTGFTCASGYNLAASATRFDRRMVGIILGNPSGPTRANRMERLLDRGFTAEISEKTRFLDDIAPRPGDPLRPVADNSSRTPVCGGGVAGYAVEIGISASRGRAAGWAEQASRRFGGQAFTTPKPGGGLVRWKAYVGGLSGTAARRICAARRASGQWCLVRSPAMVRADFQAAARYWRARR